MQLGSLFVPLSSLLFGLGLIISSPTTLAQKADKEALEEVPIEQGEVEQILAPIALYPDSLLSHILNASAYPLDIIQAAQWRETHNDLSPEDALIAAEDKSWPESVQALVPFNDLLQDLSKDLYWLENLGVAYKESPESLLVGVQALRQKAQEHGALADNEHTQILEEEGDISIVLADPEVIYVPYYDTRIVYGRWRHANNPYHWKRPSHYRSRGKFYWSPRYHFRNKVAKRYNGGHKRYYGNRKFKSYYPRYANHRHKVRRSYNGNRHFSKGSFSRGSFSRATYKRGHSNRYKKSYKRGFKRKHYRHGYKKRYRSSYKNRGFKKRHKRYRKRRYY